MTESPSEFIVREAVPRDAEAVVSMLTELAAFEGAEHAPLLDVQAIERNAFGPQRRFNLLVAEDRRKIHGMLVGFVSWFENYSSWEGAPGVHVGDLWVSAEYRNRSVGRALLNRVLSEQAGKRIDLYVLRNNLKARAFYEALGFTGQHNWCLYRRNRSDCEKISASD